MIAPLDVFFLLLVLVSGIAALAARDLLAGVIAFSAFSLFAAMLFASLGALDVAFTEAAVGAAITTVLFVTVIFRTERTAAPTARRAGRLPAAAAGVACVVAGAALLKGVTGLPAVGDPDSPSSRHVSPRYIERGPAETGAPNMVTGVLADYRGYDTLGETVVIFTGGLACLLILGRTRPPAERR